MSSTGPFDLSASVSRLGSDALTLTDSSSLTPLGGPGNPACLDTAIISYPLFVRKPPCE